MTNQEKEALLKRIYSLPTEWADAGGSYGKGGPVGSDDAAMLWPEDVIDAINQFADDTNVARKDPITGLVPCGCGGAAVDNEGIDYGYGYKCQKCGIATMAGSNRDCAKEDWNTAMGWKGGAE